jgi:hypothetical protein
MYVSYCELLLTILKRYICAYASLIRHQAMKVYAE